MCFERSEILQIPLQNITSKHVFFDPMLYLDYESTKTVQTVMDEEINQSFGGKNSSETVNKHVGHVFENNA